MKRLVCKNFSKEEASDFHVRASATVNCRPLRLRCRRLSVDRVAELLPRAVVDQGRSNELQSAAFETQSIRMRSCILWPLCAGAPFACRVFPVPAKRAILRAGCAVLLQNARLSCRARVVGVKPARNETYQENRKLGILIIEPHGIGRGS